jgi:hypothetical protein
MEFVQPNGSTMIAVGSYHGGVQLKDYLVAVLRARGFEPGTELRMKPLESF